MIFNGQSKCITNDLTSPNLESNLSELIDLCKQNINNPIIGYLNIKSPINKIDYLKDICNKSPVNIFCIDEFKIDSSFSNTNFHSDCYQFLPLRKDCSQKSEGKVVYIKEGTQQNA